jgi:hypothetical protein
MTGGASVTENESFNRHYNKELKVSEGKQHLFWKLT